MEIEEAVKVIKNKEVSCSSESCNILSEMQKMVKERTNNYKKANVFETETVDLRQVLKKSGLSPGEWQKANGSLLWSEKDTVIWLAKEFESGEGSKKKEVMRQKPAKSREYALPRPK